MVKLILSVVLMGNLLFANVGIVKKITGVVEIKRQNLRGQSPFI